MHRPSVRLIPVLFLSLVCGCRSNGVAEAPPAAPPAVFADNSRSSVDWTGVYRGTLPCADCPGIDTTVILRSDRSFRIEMVYIDRNVSPFIQEGSFSWFPDGQRISCVDRNGGRQLFLVGENRLILLDAEGNRIAGELTERFTLRKIASVPAVAPDASFLETYWKLTMLWGKPVVTPEGQKEAHLVLERKDKRVHGSGGCNRFFGSYTLLPGQRIRFLKIGSTKMACPDMDKEQMFFGMLKQVDSYTIKGNVLQFNGEHEAPIARFEAVYLK